MSSNPEPDRIQWYYRIDQTEAEFAESIGRLENDGYTLAQSHAYERPDGSRRYQAVWLKDVTVATLPNTPYEFGSFVDTKPGFR